MYYPYFRGKQFELITIRELAPIFAENNFIPIIEPVKGQLAGLQKSLDAITISGAKAIVICNPQIGEHREDGREIRDLLSNNYSDSCIIKGIILTEETSVDNALSSISNPPDAKIAIIHAGFSNAKELSPIVKDNDNIEINIFIENFCGKLYRRYFLKEERVLIRDGFQQRINREHPPTEFFSDLHATFLDENMDGFGDFLMVGDDYSETGGPAYTIAIHLTYIDEEKDNAMYIHHFKSDRQNTPQDPAGKFFEALDKLIQEYTRSKNILKTSAIEEFINLHNSHHFPGLGYLKKLSMKHHIETLANYFKECETHQQ